MSINREQLQKAHDRTIHSFSLHIHSLSLNDMMDLLRLDVIKWRLFMLIYELHILEFACYFLYTQWHLEMKIYYVRRRNGDICIK